MKLLPHYAESRSLAALCHKYGCPQALFLRNFADLTVRRLVCQVSLIIKHHTFGYGFWALNAVFLLEAAEPLEERERSDVHMCRLTVFLLLYRKRFEEAREAILLAYQGHGRDPILVRMQKWLGKLEGSR